MTISREQFLSAGSRRYEHVQVSFGKVRIQSLTESERVVEFDMWLHPKGKPSKERQRDSRLKLISLCVVDDQGKTYLSESDFPKMREMMATDVSAIARRAMVLAGLSMEDVDFAGEFEGSESTLSGSGS